MRNRISAGLVVPRSDPGAASLRKRLTFKHRPYGEQKSVTIRCYRQTKQSLTVPRQFGITARGLDNHEQFEKPRRLPSYPEIRFEGEYAYQGPWVAHALRLFRGGAYDVVGSAPTGKGKTVMALQVAQALGEETLIIVDQDNLREQWMERAEQHLGVNPKDIGSVGGGRERTSKSGFTVALIQSLYDRHDEIYEWSKQFGLVIIDEGHMVGAPRFSETLFMLACRRRFSISATPDRRDDLDRVIKWHLGDTQVVMDEKHSKSTVRVVENYTTTSWYANTSPKAGRYINELAADPVRNWILVDIIRWFVGHERSALILSDRIDQLQGLEAACYASGAATPDQIGIYTRDVATWRYVKDPEPPRHPIGWERKTEYTPVKLEAVRKRQRKGDLAAAMQKQIIFATYRMFSKGVDVPRLDAGLDATPRTAFEQIHGRILRGNVEGKVKPIWVTIRDVNSQRAEHQFHIRIAELHASNAEVFQWDRKRNAVKHVSALKLADEAERRSRVLKACRIETGPDGRNTLTIPNMQRNSVDDSGTTTGRPAAKLERESQTSRAASSMPARRRRKSMSGTPAPAPPTSKRQKSTQFASRRRRSSVAS